MSKATLTPRIKRSHAAELQYFQEQTGVPVQKCIDQAIKHWLRDEAPVWLQEAGPGPGR
jgi:hypothetical protein